ncbi:NYN domain-containing protein [Shimia sp. W99]
MKHLWLLIALVSAGGAALGATRPEWQWFAMATGAVAIAAALVWLWRILRLRRPARPFLIIDGSNVLYWDGNTPKLDTVISLVDHLEKKGFDPGVIFDANAGYLVSDRYLDDRAFARLLNLPVKQVMVVPKGTPADQYILQASQDFGVQIVTNDRFRDWADAYPEEATPKNLITGGCSKGKIWFKSL